VGTLHIERYAGGPICSRCRSALIAQWTGGDPWGIVRAMAKSPFSLEGKTAIVTGGGTGIGKSIAIEFARAGADVALCSRKLEHLEPVVKAVRDAGRRSFAVAVDVRQEDQVKAVVDRAVQEWGRLDIMVNNAGASFRAKPEDISVNGWNTVVGINLTGAFLGCKWAGRQMMQQPTGGVIVNISSVAGVYGSTMMPHYGAAKSAVITLTRELGTAWGRKGIRVNCIAPGPVETEGYLDVLKQAGPDGKKTYDAIAARVGMGRWGKVDEIAYPCIFLASDASSWMTGETIVIDGGPSPREMEG
jgi:3-oxoacyl-[acyl-carrier protein] reductase